MLLMLLLLLDGHCWCLQCVPILTDVFTLLLAHIGRIVGKRKTPKAADLEPPPVSRAMETTHTGLRLEGHAWQI